MPKWARFVAGATAGCVVATGGLLLVAALAVTDRGRFWAGVWDALASAAFFGLLLRIWFAAAAALALALTLGPGRFPGLAAAAWSTALAVGYSGYLLGQYSGHWLASAAGARTLAVAFWRHSPELAALAAAAALGGVVAGWAYRHL